MKYIWQQSSWPNLTCDVRAIEGSLARVSYRLGHFIGMLSSLGFTLKTEASLLALSTEIVESAAIEGESLNRADVRSSVAKRLDIALQVQQTLPSHAIEARVEMMLDATRGWNRPLTLKRLLSWHAALFPTGYSGLSQIRVAKLRNDAEGPMRVVSRYGSLERVHFLAPPASTLQSEIKTFLSTLNHHDPTVSMLVRIPLLHLHFLTLHPFDDGNGRLARAITEYLLAGIDQSELRFYSLSAQIQTEKTDYYSEIERAQRGSMDQTRWVEWFLGLHERALLTAEKSLATILHKAHFWQQYATFPFTPNQRSIINRLFDGFVGNLTSSKWAKICHVSQDTASREIHTLTNHGILLQIGQGRSTHYVLPPPKINTPT